MYIFFWFKNLHITWSAVCKKPFEKWLSWSKDLPCQYCCDALISKKTDAHKFLSFTALKDNGGLIYVSEDVFKVLNMSERVFKQFVCGDDPHCLKINATRRLAVKLVNKVSHEILTSGLRVFNSLWRHDLDYDCGDSDFHSTQLIKNIARKYLTTRLFRYGQAYTKDKLQNSNRGKRRQFNKFLHFQGL